MNNVFVIYNQYNLVLFVERFLVLAEIPLSGVHWCTQNNRVILNTIDHHFNIRLGTIVTIFAVQNSLYNFPCPRIWDTVAFAESVKNEVRRRVILRIDVCFVACIRDGPGSEAFIKSKPLLILL